MFSTLTQCVAPTCIVEQLSIASERYFTIYSLSFCIWFKVFFNNWKTNVKLSTVFSMLTQCVAPTCIVEQLSIASERYFTIYSLYICIWFKVFFNNWKTNVKYAEPVYFKRLTLHITIIVLLMRPSVKITKTNTTRIIFYIKSTFSTVLLRWTNIFPSLYILLLVINFMPISKVQAYFSGHISTIWVMCSGQWLERRTW